MPEELKMRIRDAKVMEASLKRRGARFTHELHVTDTYFNQPPDIVLKVTEDEHGAFLVKLRMREGKFKIEAYERLADARAQKRWLAKELGVRSVLRKRRRFFILETHRININIVEGIGDFLVVEGEKVSKSVAKELGIKNPEFITVPFDRLPRK